VRVLDFGISKVLGSLDSTATSRGAVGTPKYMSPEQVGGKDVDGRTDVWAIGIVLYRVLSGEFPFEGDGYSTFALILESEPVSLGQRRPDLPAALVDVVMRALAKAPAARHQTVGALAEKLRPFGSGRVPLPVFKSGATTARIPVDVVDAADMRRSDVDPSIPSLSRPSGATPRGRGSRVAIGALVIGGIAAVGLGIGALVGRAHRTDAPAGAGPSSAAAPPAREVAGEPPSGPGAPSSAPAATVSAAPSASPPAAQAISSAPSAVVAPRTAAPHASGRPAASAPAGTAGRPTAAPSGATKPPASAAPPPRPSASGGEIPLYL
jgi:serine/threonine-protein kinase